MEERYYISSAFIAHELLKDSRIATSRGTAYKNDQFQFKSSPYDQSFDRCLARRDKNATEVTLRT